MPLRRYLTLTLRWSWLLLLGTLLAGAAAYVVSDRQTRLYTATATVLVNRAQGAAGLSYNDVLTNERLTSTYAQLIATSPVLDQVAANLGIDLEETRTSVRAAPQRDTQLIRVSATSADPDLAAAVANETARVFGEQITQAQIGTRAVAIIGLEQQVREAEQAVAEKEGEVGRLNARPQGLPEEQRLVQLSGALGQLDVARQNLSSAQRRLQEARLEVGGSINSVVIANPAKAPSSPSSPRLLFNTLLGALVGLFVVAGIVAVIEYLDDTVSSPEEVERVSGLATLGAIRRFPQPSGGKAVGPGTLALDTASPAAEAYRIVRTNLEFARAGVEGKTILITSSGPGEGKSISTANLGVTLARTGRRVVLVDADLRRPSLHRLFGLPNSAGLSTLFVLDQPTPASFLRQTAVEGLTVLTSGPLPPNPAELLDSSRMQQILQLLEKDADLILLDSPPLLGIADSGALAGRMSAVLLIVDAGRTRAGALEHAVETLRRANATIAGVILNKVRTRPGTGYYAYYAAYGRDGRTSARDGAAAPPPIPVAPRGGSRESA